MSASSVPSSETTGPRQGRGRINWLILTLIVICCGIELVLQASDFGLIPGTRLRQTVYEYAGFWPGLLRHWEPNYPTQPYLMFATYAFLHSGLAHLVVNMVFLFTLGRQVVDRVGTRGFAILYVAAALGGAVGFGVLADTVRPMVGASGALFGLAGGLIAWNYVDRYVVADRLWPVLIVVLMLVVLNILQWWTTGGLVAWETHLGGFMTGWVVAMLIDPRGHPQEDPDD